MKTLSDQDNDSIKAIRNVFDIFILHCIPPKVRRRSLAISSTLGAGAILLSLVIIAGGTGILLSLYYTPDVAKAYPSVRNIAYTLPYGWLIRNLHRYSSDAIVIFIIIHVLRVFYTASYRHQRRWNWLVGILLYLLVLMVSWTGFLLPMDQGSYWPGIVGMNIISLFPVLGEGFTRLITEDEGGLSLMKIFSLHVLIIPFILTFSIAYHIFRIRKDGGLATSEKDSERDLAGGDEESSVFLKGLNISERIGGPAEDEEMLPSWPHLIYRLLLVFLCTFSILVIFSTIFDAPLRGEASPDFPNNPEKAPWFLLSFQELCYYSAWTGGIIYPSYVFILLLLTPFIERERDGTGEWFGGAGGKGLSITICSLSVSFIITVFFIFLYESTLKSETFFTPFKNYAKLSSIVQVINPGVIAIVTSIMIGLFFFKRRRSVRGGILGAFTSIITSSVIFLITALMRGEGWQLPFLR